MANFFRPADYAAKIHPSLKYAWINIPKNCSSFVQKVLDDNGWINLKDDMIDIVLSTESIEKFVILRDPVQRWMSGFAETFGIQDGRDPILNIDLNDLDTLLDNDAWWKIVYINPVMCFHTEMQHRYISNAKNVKYIKIQDKHPYNVPENISQPNRFYKEFSNYIISTGGTSNFMNWNELTNPVYNDKNKLRIYNKIIDCIKRNPNIIKELTDSHWVDYELFNKLQRFKI